MRIRTTILAVAILVAGAQALRGPINRSYRSLSMGGAYVAIADDKDAIHLNPAGLTQIGRKGTFVPLDSLGYLRERLELNWNFSGFDLPLGTLLDVYDYQDKYAKYYNEQNLDTLLNHPEVFDDLYQFDRKPIPVNWHGEAEFAVHNYGAAAWGEIEPELMFDHGAIMPSFEVGLRSVQAVEFATARAFVDDRLSLGVGYRIAVVTESRQPIALTDVQEGSFTNKASDIGDSTFKQLMRTGDWGHGLDFGVLWFQTPGLRYGAAIQNVGMKLQDEFVTPNLSMGTAWSPKLFQRNDKWGRKINFAAGLDDVLSDDNGYKPLSKIGFGAEWMQTVIPKIMAGRISVGIRGGYPTAGIYGELFRFLHCEVLTYSDELGATTGSVEQRYWLLKFGAGF